MRSDDETVFDLLASDRVSLSQAIDVPYNGITTA